VAARPLEVKELAEVLAFDFNTGGMPELNTGWRWDDEEEAVTSACSSLITIVKDGDSRVVQFSHFSVKEFLTADRLAEPIRDVSRYHIRLEVAHTILAQACLGVLLRLDDHVDRDNIESFPLARYAAQYWPTHGRVENVSSHIKVEIERLFDADKLHFSTWLWIYSEDRRAMYTKRPEKPEAVPLYYAAHLGFRDLTERLIVEHPEHVNARGGTHETPIHAAAFNEHVNILSLLIEHGGDMEGLRSRSGFTPLNRAAYYGKLEAGQCLVDRGANVQVRDNDRDTPLMNTARGGYVEFARMLLERGAAIDAQNNYGYAALHFAIRRGHTDVVALLLEHGADVHLRDKAGNTPSKLASSSGNQQIVELLSTHGAEVVKK
jgi:ankyrin repeat protein